MRDTAFAPGAEGMIDIAIRGERYGSGHYRIADWSDGSVPHAGPWSGAARKRERPPRGGRLRRHDEDYFV
jgi:hypothetical protein